MVRVPESVAQFLSGRRMAVAGVSRTAGQAANTVYRKLKDCGYEVFPINPNCSEVEGVRCYPNLAAIPVPVDGVVIATPSRCLGRCRTAVPTWGKPSLVPPFLRRR